MSTYDIARFLADIPPFDLLDGVNLARVAQSVDIAYFPRESLILDGSAPTPPLYLIVKGIVQAQGEGGEEYYLAKELFDTQSLIAGTAPASYRAYEETICYMIGADVMREMMDRCESFGDYFRQSIAKKLSRRRDAGELSRMAQRIRDLAYDAPLVVDGTVPLLEALTRQDETGAAAITVVGDGVYGIVTDTDLRKRVLLAGKALTVPVGEFASWELVTIREDDFLFNAIYLMTRHNIKRLVVTDEAGHPVGIIGHNEILAAYANQTQFASLKIERCRTPDALADAAADLPRIVDALVGEGVKTRHIMKLVTEIHDRLLQKLFELVVPAEIRNDLCLIVMGSEGRGEQIGRTDQDNGLIVRDGAVIDGLETIAQTITDNLLRWGYPLCEGGVMVSRPAWRKPLAVFKEDIRKAILSPTPESLMMLAILADLRPVAGAADLADDLAAYTVSHLSQERSLIARFAKPLESFGSALGLFKTFILEKGPHKGEFDIKKGGIFPLMHGVRAMAIEAGCRTTNTFDRIKDLNNRGIVERELASEMIEAMEFMMTLRLSARRAKEARGEMPDNYIRPAQLSHFDRDLLREALKVTERFKSFAAAHFKLDYIA